MSLKSEENENTAAVTAYHRSSLSRHVSSPHLDTFRFNRSPAPSSASTGSSVSTMSNVSARGAMMTGAISPHLSTFSSFATKSRPELRVQDDSNPYSVSRIQEFKIQVRDPFKQKPSSKFASPSPSARNSTAHYYQELDDYEDDEGVDISNKLDNLPSLYNRNTRNSASYEVPECEGSSGSSEDLPVPPSDISDEYSNSLSIRSSSDGMSPVPSHYNEESSIPPPTPTKISPGDRARIELSFSGRKTQIYVSESLANLYIKAKSSNSVSPRPNSAASNSTDSTLEEWVLKYTGVPVLLLDIGETKSRDKRRIQILLAELGSGLALWKDTIDNLSSYTVVGGRSSDSGSTFHTMHLSGDHTKVIGLSFDNEESAGKFGSKVDGLTSDFANISLSGAKTKSKEPKGNKEKKKRGGLKWNRPSKNDISGPCAFQHVSSICPKDKSLFSSLQHFVAPGKLTQAQNSSD